MDEEWYAKASKALAARSKRNGEVVQSPNHSLSYQTDTHIILKNIHGEMGRWNIVKQRLEPVASDGTPLYEVDEEDES